jgi:hypothetical protein
MLSLKSRRRACLAALAAAATLLAATAAIAAEGAPRVGFVNKVENEAKVVNGGSETPAIIGTPVHLKDVLRTGAEARLQVTFRDNTVLTLGAEANVVVDSYLYDPNRSTGMIILQATKGAFRFASGRIKDVKGATMAVTTPVAEIGVRGTEFWGGPMEGKYGVLLLEGEVVVSNQAGKVTLSTPGQGTDVPSPLDAPEPVKVWSAGKISGAVASVALH